MATFYFEFSDFSVEKNNYPKHGYKRVIGQLGDKNGLNVSLKYSYNAERIWLEEDSGKVVWMKNRFIDIAAEYPDLEEFFWIKLKCHPL